MLKPELTKKYKKHYILVIGILIFLAFFIAVNFYVSINYLTIEEKAKRFGLENFYGFYTAEEEDGIIFNWTGNEAVKFVEKKGDIVFIPVGNERPDIKENNVSLRISVNNQLKYDCMMNSNEWKIIPIDVGEIKDSYIKIKFDVDSTWEPAGLIKNSEDERILGIKVGEIYWE
jgi:hypothetical protein